MPEPPLVVKGRGTVAVPEVEVIVSGAWLAFSTVSVAIHAADAWLFDSSPEYDAYHEYVPGVAIVSEEDGAVLPPLTETVPAAAYTLPVHPLPE